MKSFINKTALLITLFILTNKTYAQFKYLGVGVSYISGSNSFDPEESVKGYSLNASYMYHKSEKFQREFGIEYVNAKSEYSDGAYMENKNYSSIRLNTGRVILKGEVDDRLSVYFRTGLFLGSMKIESESISYYNSDTTTNLYEENAFDAGFIAGVGYLYQPNPNLTFMADFRLVAGFQTITYGINLTTRIGFAKLK